MFGVRDTSFKKKYAGRSKARVIDNRDPLQRGRIIVNHPLLGDTVWIDYLRLPHSFDVPSIGDVVYVEAECGEYEWPIAWGNVTLGEDSAPQIPSVFKRSVPTARGMYSPGGHTIVLDDGLVNGITQDPTDTNFSQVGRGIRIITGAGNEISINETTNEKNIVLRDVNGNSIEINTQTNEIRIFSTGKITEDANGEISQTAQAAYKAKGATVKIESLGTCEIKAAGACTVEGSNITLKSSANSINGGVVTSNTVNNDPITGIPLTPVGGVVTSS